MTAWLTMTFYVQEESQPIKFYYASTFPVFLASHIAIHHFHVLSLKSQKSAPPRHASMYLSYFSIFCCFSFFLFKRCSWCSWHGVLRGKHPSAQVCQRDLPVQWHVTPSQTPLTCAQFFKLFSRHHVRTHVKAASFCMCFQDLTICLYAVPKAAAGGLLWHFMLWPTNKTTAGNCEPPGRLERHRIPNRMDFYNIWESLITFWNITWHVYYHIFSKKKLWLW